MAGHFDRRVDRQSCSVGSVGSERVPTATTWSDRQRPVVHPFLFITTAANERTAPLYDRMPVILRPEREAVWLTPPTNALALQGLLKPYRADRMEVFPVSRLVNQAGHDGAGVVLPAVG